MAEWSINSDKMSENEKKCEGRSVIIINFKRVASLYYELWWIIRMSIIHHGMGYELNMARSGSIIEAKRSCTSEVG